MKKLLKKITIAFAILITGAAFAQENLDLTSNGGVVASKYTAAKGALTATDGVGITLTTDGTANFFELRVNSVTTNGQNKATINYISNDTGVTGLILKASGTTLTSTNLTFTSTQAVDYCVDPNFTSAPGDIQLRFRFTAPATIDAGKVITFTSIIVENDPTASTDSIFSEANTYITTSNGKVIINNAPKGTSVEVFNTLGQVVKNENLKSGTYIVRVSAQGATMAKKVIVL